jgi:hypothetical protein
MMNQNQKNLKNLSNGELDQALKMLVGREREIMGEILLHLQEVDRRRLYLKFSFGSLFDYLTIHLGYSNGSAQRRIDACRLSCEVPSLLQDLESGELNLTQVSLLQKAIRQKQAQTSAAQSPAIHQVQTQEKQEILQKLKSKSIAESEILIAKALEIEIQAQTQIRYQADESVRIELRLSRTQWEKLKQLRDLLSHSLPNGSWDQVIEFVTDRFIASKMKNSSKVKSEEKQRRDKERRENQRTDDQKEEENLGVNLERKIVKEAGSETTDQVTEKQKPQSLYRLRKLVLERDRCCQYRDSLTSKICASTWQLQVDHVQPRWAGGLDEIKNLRLLCAQHNREIYRQQTGVSLK